MASDTQEANTTPSAMTGPLDTGASGVMALQALDAQAALLPYALALFGVALPIFAWACSFAPDRVWTTGSLLIFALNWAAFYAVIDALKKNASP